MWGWSDPSEPESHLTLPLPPRPPIQGGELYRSPPQDLTGFSLASKLAISSRVSRVCGDQSLEEPGRMLGNWRLWRPAGRLRQIFSSRFSGLTHV